MLPATPLLLALQLLSAVQSPSVAPQRFGPSDCVFTAFPGPIELAQPDGRRITVFARGDGRSLFLEDAAGQAVVRAGERYVYARVDEQGNQVATDLEVGRDDPAALGPVRGRRPAPLPGAEEARAKPQRAVEARPGPAFRAGGGSAKNLVLLLRFADHGPSGQNRTLPTALNVDVIMNAVGGHPSLAPTGSVRDHYLEDSYDQFTIDSTVVGWLDMPGTEFDYAGGISGLGPVVWDLITDGLDAADATVDFTDFDTDGDGWIDAITFLHSGYGAEWISTDQYGTPYWDRIWSHKWTIPTWTSAEGVKVGDYNISPGLWGTSGSGPGRIGVVVHELGHFFGLPDLYDTDGNGQGIGNWDVMAAGSWGFDGSQQYPTHMSSWSKAKLGWMEPALLRPGARTLDALETGPAAFRLDNGYPPGEYLLLENRQTTGFDSVLPQAGLVVWHVDEAKGSFGNNDPNTDEGHPFQAGWPSNGHHYRVAMLQADGGFDMERNFDRGDSGDPYHGFGVSSISAGSSPNLDAYQGGNVIANGNSLASISVPSATMSFTYALAGAPAIQDQAFAPGRVDQSYSFALSSTGGSGSKSWSEYRTAPSYASATLGAGFPGGGTAQGWKADDAVWSLSLPFAFPFYETQYTTAYVSSNGFLDFVPSTPEPFNHPLYLRSTLRVAPLWTDLTTAGALEDVFVESTSGHVRVRWVASSVATGNPCNFALVLYPDGRIRFEYGTGNQGLVPTVGISRGHGSDFVLAQGYDGEPDLQNADQLELRLGGSRLPAGLSLSTGGVLSGIPLEYGIFRPLVRATDTAYRYDQRELVIYVAPRRFHLDLTTEAR